MFTSMNFRGGQWPRRTFPGIISALTSMGFQEYGVTMKTSIQNGYDKVIESAKNVTFSDYDRRDVGSEKQSLGTTWRL